MNRLVSIDILRGIAIWMVLILHVFAFAYSGTTFVLGWNDPLDNVISWCVEILTRGKFNVIFSFLFGLAAAWQRGRGRSAWLRRMVVLLLIGIIHHSFWRGDILLAYGAIGFYLPLFWDWPPKRLFLAANGFLCVPVIIFLYHAALFHLGVEVNIRSWALTAQIAHFWPRAAGMMLLGLAASQVDFMKWVKSLSLLFLVGLPVVLFVAVAKTSDGIVYFVGNAAEVYGAALIGMGYVGLVLWLHEQIPGRHYLAAIGRMSLTNYLSQTFVLSLLFHGGDTRLWLKPMDCLLLSGALFICQAVFSYIWLQWFKYGPVEYLWRLLSGRKYE